MTMVINIKNERTCELARQLADLTGDTMTGAITVALEEKIETVKRKRERDRDDLLRDIEAISKRCAAKMGPGPTHEEIVDSMYGEYGEPV